MIRRKLLILPAILLISAVTLVSGIRFLSVSLAKNKLKELFPQSTVTIKQCIFSPLSRLSLQDIEIKKAPLYAITVKEAGLNYTPASLLRLTIPRIYLRDARISIDSSKKIIPELVKYASKGNPPGLFSFRELELKDIKVQVKSMDFSASGNFSVNIGLPGLALEYCCINAETFRFENTQFKNLYFCAKRNKPEGMISIQEVMFDKAKIKNIRSSAFLNEKEIFFGNLKGEVFGGTLTGAARLMADRWSKYEGDFNFQGLGLDDFVIELELEKKFRMTGKINGDLKLKGEGTKLNIISGAFYADGQGGTLVITDTEFLKNLAEKTHEPVNILVEGFKNYHYNVGTIGLSIDKGDLICEAKLDGKNGKRDLIVVLHGFNLEGGE